ncbi:MAG TPA: SpoIIE family protein phosphatase [Bacteroidia bacterium]|jgi:PAS domain S-box-containing protein|nr:SpoIIE family protein phosphatase [Bacteroidia bacterium]
MLRVFNTVLQQLNNLVVVVDSGGKVTYVGPSAERMLGFKTGELLGDKWWARTCYNIADPAQRKTEVNHLLKQVANGKAIVAPVEHRINTASGDSRWFLWNLSAGPDGSLVKIGYDITERKQKEQEILVKNKELSNRNREIFESLEYARNIQQAILPSAEKLKGGFAEVFKFYQPKDVVSGDFYWAHIDGDVSYAAVVDCTGHGVPGALMTIMANGLLKDIVIKRKITEPKDVLSALDDELQQMINGHGNTVKANDGMDMAFIKYDKTTGLITYAGAFRPIVVVSDGVITEYRGSRYPIGFYHDVVKHYEQVSVAVKPCDLVYIFSDGYADQFGGEEGKKFNKKNFKELLLSVNDMELEVQRSFLEYSLLNWRQKEPQTDDVLVVGFKV